MKTEKTKEKGTQRVDGSQIHERGAVQGRGGQSVKRRKGRVISNREGLSRLSKNKQGKERGVVSAS